MATANPPTKVLITGGNGFLGRFIVDALREQHPEYSLSILDIQLPEPSQCEAEVSYHSVDLRDASAVRDALSQIAPTAIIHTAGIVPGGNARYTRRNYAAVYDVNVNGTKHILAAARECGVRALVLTSSCTVVSDDLRRDYPNMDERVPIGNATLVYGQTKAIAETLVLEANGDDMYTCALRPHTIIAPDDTVCLPSLYLAMKNGLAPFQIGSGENMYDFVYGPNVADAHVLALENLLQEEKSCLHPRKPQPEHMKRKSMNGTSNGRSKEFVDEFTNYDGFLEETKDGHPSAAGEAFFINNAAPLSFRLFMLAVWKEMGHIPRFTMQIPYWLGWSVGGLFDMWDWVSGGWLPEGALSRALVGDAVHTMYSNGDKAKKILGYYPRVPFNEAVKTSVRGFMRKMKEREIKR